MILFFFSQRNTCIINATQLNLFYAGYLFLLFALAKELQRLLSVYFAFPAFVLDPALVGFQSVEDAVRATKVFPW